MCADAHRGRGSLESRGDGTGRILVTVCGPSISNHEIIGPLPLKDLGATWLIPGVPMGVSDGQHRWVVSSESMVTGTSGHHFLVSLMVKHGAPTS